MRKILSLEEVRFVIRRKQRVKFTYGREPYVAEFHLLAHARKTRAYIVVAWCIEPAVGWQHLRYANIYDLEALLEPVALREDLDPYDPRIIGIDTRAFENGGWGIH